MASPSNSIALLFLGLLALFALLGWFCRGQVYIFARRVITLYRERQELIKVAEEARGLEAAKAAKPPIVANTAEAAETTEIAGTSKPTKSTKLTKTKVTAKRTKTGRGTKTSIIVSSAA
ncbi:Fc.00g113420.m01.CDS01 [Cosmosporella sp. VM-42]